MDFAVIQTSFFQMKTKFFAIFQLDDFLKLNCNIISN